MVYESELKHAWELYYNGVNAEGSQKKHYLQQAMRILNGIPQGYGNSDELRKRIKPML
ncbi:MAG: hypothetical protein IKX20_11630 [Paludibacteraceae bacterium]|nr:hypothetical protein [Paludibacteraceae bacterium]